METTDPFGRVNPLIVTSLTDSLRFLDLKQRQSPIPHFLGFGCKQSDEKIGFMELS